MSTPKSRPLKIVVLDGYTLNPGDLSWNALEQLGECRIHDRTAPGEVVARASGADLVLTNKTPLRREHLEKLDGLRYIGVLATGYNVVDVAAARERAIPVTNVPTYGTRSVAQMTFALLLELTQQVGHHARTVAEGRWARSADFCYWDYPLIELEGRTLGIIGYGRIGAAVAEVGRALGMSIVATVSARRQGEALEGVRVLALDDLLRQSDVVSLHCPLTPETRHLINAERLALMKPGAYLLNTSRGPLIDEEALAEALNAGRIAGAALDVLGVEPPAPDNPLFSARHCLITPHIAWATAAARTRLLDTAVANVAAFLAGQPQNVVNGG